MKWKIKYMFPGMDAYHLQATSFSVFYEMRVPHLTHLTTTWTEMCSQNKGTGWTRNGRVRWKLKGDAEQKDFFSKALQRKANIESAHRSANPVTKREMNIEYHSNAGCFGILCKSTTYNKMVCGSPYPRQCQTCWNIEYYFRCTSTCAKLFTSWSRYCWIFIYRSHYSYVFF